MGPSVVVVVLLGSWSFEVDADERRGPCVNVSGCALVKDKLKRRLKAQPRVPQDNQWPKETKGPNAMPQRTGDQGWEQFPSTHSQ